MKDNMPGKADYILAVMYQITDKAAKENMLSEDEKEELDRLNEKTVNDEYTTAREWEIHY